MSRPGIVYQPTGDPGSAVEYLPLEELQTMVLIIDVTARVTLTQVYTNASNSATQKCKYIFPVPASAAVCAFDMQTSDGRTITGVVKQKDQAREQYEEALQAGHFSGLVTYVTDDIFTITTGALGPGSNVRIMLTYIMNLANDDNADEVRFQLPMGVGERYGTPPSEIADAFAPTTHTRVRIRAEIQMSGRIQQISSPSHPDGITQVRYPTHQGRESRRRFTIKYGSSSYLDRDFVLVIQSCGLDAPRCFAELQRDAEGRGRCTIAMQLFLVPKHSLPPIAAQEYLFLIDQSGSMSGGRITQAKQTVNLLLRMLPTHGTVFNIFVFSKSVSGMWPRSRVYDQGSLDTATTYIDTLGTLGGTEISRALQYVLRSRNRDIPTATFVLTDGEVYDEALKAISFVEAAVTNAASHAPLRVFTLGIGSGVSTATCEGIAKAGHGACFFALDTEHILGKCARLFVAGRTPFVENITMDWGVPDGYFAPTTVVTFPSQSSRTVAIRELPVIQQVPSQIHELHAGTRISISVLITLRREYVPKEVTLRGELRGTGTPFELTIPIRGVQLSDAEPRMPPIHRLAAWRLIQEHQEGRATLPAPLDISSTQDEIRKAVIVQLGEKYQLVSQYTSFVATDSGPSKLQTHGQVDNDNTIRARFQDLLSGIFGIGIHNPPEQNSTVPGAWPEDSWLASHPSSEDQEDNDDGYSSSGAESFSTLSSLESCGWCDWSTPPSPLLDPIPDDEDESQHSPRFESLDLAPDNVRQQIPPPLLVRAPTPPPAAPQQVVNLFRLQLYDGSFPLSEALARIIGGNIVNNLQVQDSVWATALSVAFIKKHMANRTDLLHDLLVKAEEYMGKSGVDVGEIIMEAGRWIL